MADAGPQKKPGADPVAAYKEMLARILERRPSGTRQRLATALNKNRSFISQIANPSYATPIPPAHLAQIFEICHFSAAEKREFARLYAEAHPKKMLNIATPRPTPGVQLPDLGDDELNRKLHGLVSGFVRQIAKLMDESKR
jgi:hypothetical protein